MGEMAQSTPALVEPSVLRWARESIGLTPLAAARKIKVPDDRIEEWESGTAAPSIVQLRAAATVYKRPLGVFFLPEPPTTFDTMRDFRRPQGAAAGIWSPDLHGEYRRALTQREYALELADIEDTEISTSWRLKELPEGDDPIAAAARQLLLDTSPLALPTGTGTAYEHLKVWVAGLEEAGVLVLATSGGGVTTEEMRAFSLYFDTLPVIVVNGSDSPRGRLFSLLHEYAHLLLHSGGLCDTVTDLQAVTPDRRLETRCNALAAAVLMPRDAVLANPEVRARERAPNSWDYDALGSAAASFGVSAEAFLRRLVTLDRVDGAFYQPRREEFLAAYQQDEATTKPGGGNWYRNTARDRGKGYVRRVADAHRRRTIDSYTAASFLNVKVSQIPRLAEAAALQAPA